MFWNIWSVMDLSTPASYPFQRASQRLVKDSPNFKNFSITAMQKITSQLWSAVRDDSRRLVMHQGEWHCWGHVRECRTACPKGGRIPDHPLTCSFFTVKMKIGFLSTIAWLWFSEEVNRCKNICLWWGGSFYSGTEHCIVSTQWNVAFQSSNGCEGA